MNKQADWRDRIDSALKGNRRDAYSRYLQLATVGLDGAPRCRTVVFRGFQEEGNTLLAITDGRSQKVAEIARDSRAQVHWYFVRSREQFRMETRITTVDLVSQESLVADLWSRLSEAARAQFFWRPPGEAVNTGESVPPTENPPDNFLVMLIEPQQVDYLWLGKRHRRVISVRSGDTWSEGEVNP
jgi:PPOX class probable FMN-dependent enzyme